MQKEPLITIGSIATVIVAFVVLMQSFGVPVTDAQLDAIQNFVTISAPLLIALVGRQFVYSPNTVKDIADQQYSAGLPPAEPQPVVPPPANAEP